MPQLAITLDNSLLQAAQEYASRHGQDLNAWVAQLMAEAMEPTTEAPADQPARPLSPRIQRLFGAVKVPADFDHEKVLDEAMRERYGI